MECVLVEADLTICKKPPKATACDPPVEKRSVKKQYSACRSCFSYGPFEGLCLWEKTWETR